MPKNVAKMLLNYAKPRLFVSLMLVKSSCTYNKNGKRVLVAVTIIQVVRTITEYRLKSWD